ncbi:MAG: thiamine-phosphate kinase [Actinomycetota bacterium]
MNYSGPTVFELGEVAALKLAVKNFRKVDTTLVGSGDDAAVVAVSDGRFVVTTDTMVEGHDFRNEFSSGYDLGFKAVASNVADVAAMGAKPIALVVAMVITKDTTQMWLEDFARGLQAGCNQLAPQCEIVGGDLASGEQNVIAVTAHGHLAGAQPVLRSGAKPGDKVALAGTLGRAACGLDLLLHPDESLAKAYDEWVAVQLRPTPPIELGVLAANSATAMLDVSDSLALDCNRLANASEVSIELDRTKLEGYAAVLELAALSMTARDDLARDPMDWVLFGGEDHSLLATFPEGAEIPRGFKVIGEVVQRQKDAVTLGGNVLAARGWDSVSS